MVAFFEGMHEPQLSIFASSNDFKYSASDRWIKDGWLIKEITACESISIIIFFYSADRAVQWPTCQEDPISHYPVSSLSMPSQLAFLGVPWETPFDPILHYLSCNCIVKITAVLLLAIELYWYTKILSNIGYFMNLTCLSSFCSKKTCLSSSSSRASEWRLWKKHIPFIICT